MLDQNDRDPGSKPPGCQAQWSGPSYDQSCCSTYFLSPKRLSWPYGAWMCLVQFAGLDCKSGHGLVESLGANCPPFQQLP